MRRILLALTLLSAVSITATAQRVDLGIFGGATNYMGDLVENGIYLPHTLPGGGIFFRYNASRKFAIRVGFDYGKIQGDDFHSSDSQRVLRNLSFQSTIIDGHALLEYHPFDIMVGRKKYIAPFLMAGISVFHFNPKAEWRGQLVELQPIGTEGQGLPEYPARKAYSLTQVSYPIGIGIKYIPNDVWTISFETRWHWTSTDYLDDVSSTYPNQAYMLEHKGLMGTELSDRGSYLRGRYALTNAERGNENNNDWFTFTGITISWSPQNYTCDRDKF